PPSQCRAVYAGAASPADRRDPLPEIKALLLQLLPQLLAPLRRELLGDVMGPGVRRRRLADRGVVRRQSFVVAVERLGRAEAPTPPAILLVMHYRLVIHPRLLLRRLGGPTQYHAEYAVDALGQAQDSSGLDGVVADRPDHHAPQPNRFRDQIRRHADERRIDARNQAHLQVGFAESLAVALQRLFHAGEVCAK